MGQKIHSRAVRLGITAVFRAKWHVCPKEYSKNIKIDLSILAYLKKALNNHDPFVGEYY